MTGFFYMQQSHYIKKFLNTLLFSNFFVSLSALTLTLSTYLILQQDGLDYVSWHLIVFVFCSTLFVYNLYIIDYSSFIHANSIRESWISKNYKFVKTSLLISFFGIAYSFFFLNLSQLFFLIHLAALSLLYVLPIKLGRFRFSLRESSMLKIFILTYVWAAVTVVLPAIDIYKVYETSTVIAFCERFIFILALAIPFDIRDYYTDRQNNIKTLPGMLGILGAKRLSIILLLSYILISFIIHSTGYISISRLLSGALAIFFISRIREGMNETFYMFYIDGIMVFHFLILWAAYLVQ